MPPQLRFREDRATQAAAFLLKLNKKRIRFPSMRYIKLLKLLYLSDRAALVELGHLITYDRLVSMDNGPVLSRVYDMLKGKRDGGFGHHWAKHISRYLRWWVLLREDPGVGQLSPAEEQVLSDVYRRYGHLNWRQLIAISHDLPEWRDPDGSSLPIEPKDILVSEHVPPAEAEEIIADMAAASSL